MNGGSLSRNGGGAAAGGVGRVAVAMAVPVSCISTAEAAAASDDGIMLRHVSVGVSLRGVVWMVVVVMVVVVVAERCCCFFGLVRVLCFWPLGLRCRPRRARYFAYNLSVSPRGRTYATFGELTPEQGSTRHRLAVQPHHNTPYSHLHLP